MVARQRLLGEGVAVLYEDGSGNTRASQGVGDDSGNLAAALQGLPGRLSAAESEGRGGPASHFGGGRGGRAPAKAAQSRPGLRQVFSLPMPVLRPLAVAASALCPGANCCPAGSASGPGGRTP